MPRSFVTAVLAAFLLTPVAVGAQDEDTARALFGGDRYAAGQDFEINEPTRGDLFAAGEEVALEADVDGAAHLAGRRVQVQADIGGAVYAAGYEIELEGDFAGPMSLFAAEITIDGTVGGNLRAFASDLSIDGVLGGSAILGADELNLDATVAGDLMLSANRIEFGDEARVTGQVILYAEEGAAPEIPERVAPADRIEVRDPGEWDTDARLDPAEFRRAAQRAAIRGFILSVLFVAALATIAVVVAPQHVADWRARALAEPGRNLLWGFLTTSVLMGGGLVLAMTVIGLPLLPGAFFVAGFAGFAGYVLGSYVLGVALWQRFGNEIPTEILPRVGLAVLGAFVAGVGGLVPFLGWLFIMALALFGLGALVNHHRSDTQPD